MIKKISSLIIGSMFLFSVNAFASDAKGLNVMLTSKVPQTQQMAMVLSMMTLKKGKNVNMVLCSDAGDLAIKGKKSPALKPMDKSPKMMLQAIMKKGANVEICPLYLPNANLKKSDLIGGITVAKPPVVADKLLNSDYTTLSY
ncbi:MAG: hypothetical protein ACQERD_10435 [Campylobacterota bacterium]